MGVHNFRAVPGFYKGGHWHRSMGVHNLRRF
jgi:hypothetical protein